MIDLFGVLSEYSSAPVPYSCQSIDKIEDDLWRPPFIKPIDIPMNSLHRLLNITVVWACIECNTTLMSRFKKVLDCEM